MEAVLSNGHIGFKSKEKLFETSGPQRGAGVAWGWDCVRIADFSASPLSFIMVSCRMGVGTDAFEKYFPLDSALNYSLGLTCFSLVFGSIY